MLQRGFEIQNGRRDPRRGHYQPSTWVWVGCTWGGSWSMVPKPRPFLTYSQVISQYPENKERWFSGELIFCRVIVGYWVCVPTGSKASRPNHFSSLLLPFPAIILIPPFHIQSNIFFQWLWLILSTVLFFASWFLGHKHILMSHH